MVIQGFGQEDIPVGKPSVPEDITCYYINTIVVFSVISTNE